MNFSVLQTLTPSSTRAHFWKGVRCWSRQTRFLMRLRNAEEDPILSTEELIKLIRSGGLRDDVRTKNENRVKVVDMFFDKYSTPWVHPKPPGLRMTTADLSNGLVAYVHTWICPEFDDELKWYVKKYYNMFPQMCRNEETIRALGVPGDFQLGPSQQVIFNRHTPGVANLFLHFVRITRQYHGSSRCSTCVKSHALHSHTV